MKLSKSHKDTWGKGVLGSGNSRDNGPEATEFWGMISTSKIPTITYHCYSMRSYYITTYKM